MPKKCDMNEADRSPGGAAPVLQPKLMLAGWGVLIEGVRSKALTGPGFQNLTIGWGNSCPIDSDLEAE